MKAVLLHIPDYTVSQTKGPQFNFSPLWYSQILSRDNDNEDDNGNYEDDDDGGGDNNKIKQQNYSC